METITEGAIRPNSIIGKPLVVYIDGKRVEIGVITNAAVRDGRMYFGADIAIKHEDAEDLTDLIEQKV
jgi:hypothetical protein